MCISHPNKIKYSNYDGVSLGPEPPEILFSSAISPSAVNISWVDQYGARTSPDCGKGSGVTCGSWDTRSHFMVRHGSGLFVMAHGVHHVIQGLAEPSSCTLVQVYNYFQCSGITHRSQRVANITACTSEQFENVDGKIW